MDISSFLIVIDEIPLRKSKALFAYLTLDSQEYARSELLMEIFWPDANRSGRPDRFSSLRQAVRAIRTCLHKYSEDKIEHKLGAYGLTDPSSGNFFKTLLSSLDKSQLQTVQLSQLRRFIAELEQLIGTSDLFDNWLAILLTSAKNKIVGKLEPFLHEGFEDSRKQIAAEFALELDPVNEHAARFLMRMHWIFGAPQRSVSIYNELYRQLDVDYDQEPQYQTIGLLSAIKLDPQGAASYQQNNISPPSKICIEVLQLDNSNALPRDRSLLSILHAEILLRLSRFREWEIATKSAGIPGLVKISSSLEVFDKSKKLILNVVRGDSRELVWSEMIDNPIIDFEEKLRASLARISSAISTVARNTQVSTLSASIYTQWLEAQVLLDTWSPSNEGRAIAVLKKVITDAPDFAPAHAELAGAINVRHILLPGTYQTSTVKDEAIFHARAALAQDPLDTRALRVAGWCYCHNNEFDLAEFHFDQAIAVNKDNLLTLSSCALGFAFSDNDIRAIQVLDNLNAVEEQQSPFHKIYAAAVHFLGGRYDQALSYCEQGQGTMSVAGGWHTLALLALNREQEARSRWIKYCEEIDQRWAGEGRPSESDIAHWLVSVFPLRQNVTKRKMTDALQRVVRH